jgi:hypothetical protein
MALCARPSRHAHCVTINEHPGKRRGEWRVAAMTRFRLVLLSLFAVLAVGALASASASAEECINGTKPVFCRWPGNTPIHLLKILGESHLSVLTSSVGGAEVKLHCPDDLFRGETHLLGLILGEIDFLGCTVETPANCTVGEGTNKLILALVHIQLLPNLMPALGLATGIGPEEEFTKIKIAGTGCAIPGEYKITGLQSLEFPNGESGLVNHEIVAKKALSKLKLGVEKASFSSIALVHLHSLESWLIMLGV